MLKKVFSILSALCFVFIILPLILPDSPKGFDMMAAILNVHVFLTLILGVAGIIFGVIGVKGQVRLYLVFLNVFVLGFYIFATFIGLIGFKEP